MTEGQTLGSVDYARLMGESHARDGAGFTNPFPLGTAERKAWQQAYDSAPKGVPGHRCEPPPAPVADPITHEKLIAAGWVRHPTNSALLTCASDDLTGHPHYGVEIDMGKWWAWKLDPEVAACVCELRHMGEVELFVRLCRIPLGG